VLPLRTEWFDLGPGPLPSPGRRLFLFPLGGPPPSLATERPSPFARVFFLRSKCLVSKQVGPWLGASFRVGLFFLRACPLCRDSLFPQDVSFFSSWPCFPGDILLQVDGAFCACCCSFDKTPIHENLSFSNVVSEAGAPNVLKVVLPICFPPFPKCLLDSSSPLSGHF